jgi:hypothetical protein
MLVLSNCPVVYLSCPLNDVILVTLGVTSLSLYKHCEVREYFSVLSMFVWRKFSLSALFTFLVGWHASADSLPQGDIIFAQLACPLNEVIFTNIEYYSVSLALLTFWSGGTPVLLASSVPASLTSE